MTYIQPIPRERATGNVAKTLDGIAAKLGGTPNLFLTLAVSPAALQAYVALAGAAAGGTLDAKQREQIALAVAEANSCDYCLAAHAAIGAKLGLSASDIADARAARAKSPRDAALVRLARAVVEQRGHVPAAELDAFKAAGFGDDAILEVVVSVVLNLLTNYTNHIAGTEVDFPRVESLLAA